MFRLIKQAFIGLLNLSGALATKYMSLKNESCVTGLFLWI